MLAPGDRCFAARCKWRAALLCHGGARGRLAAVMARQQARPTRILTGIKPTGSPHLGNLLGAIRPALRLAENHDQLAMYFIADYHALISIHDRTQLQQLTFEVAATWLAFGLDPERTLFYRQSDIPEIFELSWVLACMTSKGWMNKAHAYKARVAENQAAGSEDVDAGVSMGLYSYPVLMAADILAFDTDVVPVGKDQVQHIEIARDIAQRFNHVFGAEVLTPPAASLEENLATIPGLDGRKMSKSYDNTLPLFLPAKKLRKLVNRIVTDSLPPEAPKDPDSSSLFALYRLLADNEQTVAMRDRYQRGVGWGEVKGELFELLEEELREPRERYEALMADLPRLEELLRAGAKRARAMAAEVLDRVRQAAGLGGRL